MITKVPDNKHSRDEDSQQPGRGGVPWAGGGSMQEGVGLALTPGYRTAPDHHREPAGQGGQETLLLAGKEVPRQ